MQESATGAASGGVEVPDQALATDFVLAGLHGIVVTTTHRPRSHRHRLVDSVVRLVSDALGIRAPRCGRVGNTSKRRRPLASKDLG